MRRFATPACELRKRGFLFLFLLVHFFYSFLPLGLRLEAKATNKNEIKFCLGPFALVLHAYAAAATYAKARVGLGQLKSK
jgi:hypothetical protein